MTGPLGLSQKEFEEIDEIRKGMFVEKIEEGGVPKSAFDVQVGGGHYKKYKIQPTQFLYANDIDHLRGEIICRVLRFKDKFKDKEKRIEDLRKAQHEIEMLIELA